MRTVAGRFGGAGGERLDEVNLKSVEATFGGDCLGGSDRVKPAAETRGPNEWEEQVIKFKPSQTKYQVNVC